MNKSSRIVVTNGEVITPYRHLVSDIVIEDGVISSVTAGSESTPATRIVDARDCYVIPGLIDLHAHGGGGFDFMDATEEAFIGAGRAHLARGTTTMLPTTLSSTFEALKDVVSAYDRIGDMESIPFFSGTPCRGTLFLAGTAGRAGCAIYQKSGCEGVYRGTEEISKKKLPAGRSLRSCPVRTSLHDF